MSQPTTDHDPVAKPRHYRSHKSGVETIDLTELLSFCLGNAVKYLMREAHKGSADEDRRKAAWYLRREGRHDGLYWVLPEAQAIADRIRDHEADDTALAALLDVIASGLVKSVDLLAIADHLDPKPGAEG